MRGYKADTQQGIITRAHPTLDHSEVDSLTARLYQMAHFLRQFIPTERVTGDDTVGIEHSVEVLAVGERILFGALAIQPPRYINKFEIVPGARRRYYTRTGCPSRSRRCA